MNRISEAYGCSYLRWKTYFWTLFLVMGLLPTDSAIWAQIPPDTLPVFVIDTSRYTNELDTDWVFLSNYLQYLPTAETELTIEQVASGAFQSRFLPYLDHFPTPDNSSVYWLKLEIRNDMAQRAELALYLPSLVSRVFAFRESKQIDFYSAGFDLPIAQWAAMQALPPVFDPATVPFEVPPQTSITYYLQLGPGFFMGSVVPEFTLFTQRSFYAYDAPYFNRQMQWQAALQGMLLMILLFNLLMFVNNRDPAYLFYSLYVACIAYYFMLRFGYDRYWIWGQEAAFHPIGQNLSVYGICIFYPLFTIYFLHREDWQPRLKQWMQYVVYAAFAGAVISSLALFLLPLSVPEGNELINGLFLPTGIFGIGVFLYTHFRYLRSDNQPARYFALAGFTLLLGIIPMFLHSILLLLDLLKTLSSNFLNTFPADDILQVSCLLQILMFALALSYRSRLIEKERTALQEMEHTKARFFANISHEFKTPLTLILGPANDLAERAADEPSRQLLALIRRNARRLLKLINEILDLAKMDAGKMPLHVQTGELISFTRKLTEQFQSYCDSKNMELTFSSSSPILPLNFDRDKLEKVLTNLLSNACKFTPKGGNVSIHLRREKRAGRSGAAIAISDTGIGIDQSHLPHLFDRFYQAEQSGYTTDQPSTGIGLALTKELVQLHEGTIQVRSALGRGTIIEVFLPADLPGSEEAIPETDPIAMPLLETPMISGGPVESSAPADEDRPEILLIEDNIELRAYIRSGLENSYNVITAKDGQEGLELAVQRIPSLVITDVMMPRMDGFTVSRTLKQNEKTDHIPIIILTGKSSRTSKLEGLETAADVYLSKPFDAEELQLHIHNLLDNRRRLQAHFSQRLLLETTGQEVDSQEEVFLRKAIAVVEDHLDDEDFSVEQFSEALLMDRTQLFRKLRALTDQNPSTFIRNIRLKRARQLIEGDAGTISEIAFAVGFRSTAYFIKCFREVYGESPGKWRS